eukprot:2339763-Prorocentrum_lima.AAC.1
MLLERLEQMLMELTFDRIHQSFRRLMRCACSTYSSPRSVASCSSASYAVVRRNSSAIVRIPDSVDRE